MSAALTPAERQRRRSLRLAKQGQVRVSAWLPTAAACTLERLARDAKVTQRVMLARLIEAAGRPPAR
jgi:hypothetical protein